MSKLIAIVTVLSASPVYVQSSSIRAIQEGPNGVNYVDLIRGEQLNTKQSVDGLHSAIGVPAVKLRDLSNTTLIIPVSSIHYVQEENKSSARVRTRDGHEYLVLGQARSVSDRVDDALSSAANSGARAATTSTATTTTPAGSQTTAEPPKA